MSADAKPEKFYILTRRDLSGEQAIVQTAHAMAEFMFKHGDDP